MPAYIHKPTLVHAYPTRVRTIINTLEGDMVAEVGDYIVHGDHGERWPVKPEIFLNSYEPIISMSKDNPLLKAVGLA